MTTQEAINYFKNCHIITKYGTENYIKAEEVKNLAIKALEKQIPKKARYKIVGNGWNDWAEGKCPVCGTNNKNTPIYCPCCGQHIDWGENNG